MDKSPHGAISNKRTVPRKGNGSRDTLTQSLRTELVADEGGDGDIVAEFLAGLVEEGLHRHLSGRVLHKYLVQQAGLGVQSSLNTPA